MPRLWGRFLKRLGGSGQLASVLQQINADLESQDLTLSNGKYLSSDATLIQSARRPHKHLQFQGEEVGIQYADDQDTSWLKKGGMMRKKPKGNPMSHWYRIRNKLMAKRRFVFERTFGTLKRTYGLHQARHLGLIKTQAEVILKSIAYNLKRAINRIQHSISQPSCV
jgi:Transposase DDE domain